MINDTVTLKYIAKLLGISKSTVSRALSEHSDVNAATRKKILELAQQLNYQPNMLALNLKKQRTHIIGVIVPETVNRFFSKAVGGIQHVANLAGYHVMICQSDESFITERNNLRSLTASHVDGLIISVSGETNSTEHFDVLLHKRIPVVFFDRVREELITSHVCSDNYEIGFTAAEHLIEQGCQRIAIVGGPQNLVNSQNRLKGYLDALKKHDRIVNNNYIIHSDFRGRNIEEYTDQLLQLPERPDAIIAINDYAAAEMMHMIKKKGLRIPDDIAVLGFNNEKICRFLEPPLSSIELSPYDLGASAAEILVSQMKNPDHHVQKKIVKGHLIIRESTQRKTLL
jgi:DNA-binding LacI/PurR family transcriptional regulator